MDSLIRLTLYEILIFGSKLSDDKCWIYNSDQILSQSSWWVVETDGVPLKDFFQSSAGLGATPSPSVHEGTQTASQPRLRSGTRVCTSLCPTHFCAVPCPTHVLIILTHGVNYVL